MEEVRITVAITKDVVLPLREGLAENRRAKNMVIAFVNAHQPPDGASFYCRAYITDDGLASIV